MKRRFEDILAECLEAVTTGQRTIDQCLALYPQWADRLRPLLRLSSRLEEAASAEPSPVFRQAARERFLAAARSRASAPSQPQGLLPAARAYWQRVWRPVPAAGARRAAAALTAAVLIVFLGFSSFVVASAGDSVPGDWRYPVKRLTERTRLTFTFGEDARRAYRISLAEERLQEVQKLASSEHSIEESVLRQLVDTTEPLVAALEPESVPSDQIERITDLTARQQDVLEEVAPLVDEAASDELEEARLVSSEGHEKAVLALASARSDEESAEEVLLPLTTPQAGTATAEAGSAATSTAQAGPEGSPTEEASATPEQTATTDILATPSPQATPTATPRPGEPTPEVGAPTATPTPPGPETVFLPDDTTAGITWSLMSVGGFSLRVPAEGEASWVVSVLTGSSGDRILIAHRSTGGFDAVVVIQAPTGQADVHARIQGTTQSVSIDQLRGLVSKRTMDAISHVLESISPPPQ